MDSTLWEEPLEVRVLFMTMLALKEYDHVVRLPFRRLCKKSNMEPEKVKMALDILMAPDKRSIDVQPEEGRRVKPVEDGWLIVNGEYYRQEMAKLMRRFSKNQWQRENRAKKRLEKQGKPLPGEDRYLKAERNGAPQEVLDRLSDPANNRREPASASNGA